MPKEEIAKLGETNELKVNVTMLIWNDSADVLYHLMVIIWTVGDWVFHANGEVAFWGFLTYAHQFLVESSPIWIR